MNFAGKSRRALLAIGASAFAGMLLPGAAPAKVFVQEGSFGIAERDAKPRSTVRCPGGKKVTPLGGGMVSSPTPSRDGEGVYPHSYERLGSQRGWHVTPVLYDPSPRQTTPRTVTMQVVCGPKSRPVVPMRNTVYVAPGQTKSATARCPGKRSLFGGGFQRTNFVSRGGNYVTGSYASSKKTWTVTGSAFGSFGGELTAIVYCRAGRKAHVTPVTGQTTVNPNAYAQAQTPACPRGRVMIFGGFATSPANSTLFADGFFTPGRTWVAGVYNQFGPPTTLTSYGYCHSRKFPKARKEKNPFRTVKAPDRLKKAEKAVISERVVNGGCYPPPAELANAIQRRTGLKTGVAHRQQQVRKPGKVYVLARGASCDLVRLSLRKQGRVYTINSATGMVKVKG